MLQGRDGGVNNAKTPQPVERADRPPGIHLAQQLLQIDGGEHRKGYMHRWAGVGCKIVILEEGDGRMLRPVNREFGYRRRPKNKNTQTDHAQHEYGQSIGYDLATVPQQRGSNRNISPERQIDRQSLGMIAYRPIQ